MRRLILADIHANLPAFEAVLRAAGPVDEVIFLGDLVGYGPHPAACVDLMMTLDPIAVYGNHDIEVFDPPAFDLAPDSDAGAIWLHWTYHQLSDEQRQFLRDQPHDRVIQSAARQVRLVHYLNDGRYLHPAMPDELFAAALAGLAEDTVYTGHNHRTIDRSINGKRLVCVKAVGQARDSDPVAGYAIETDGRIRHHTVAYPVEQTVAAVQRLPLPELFRTRWLNFLRTGYDSLWSRDYQP